ncbi:epidermal growth factor receptor kinase substrate 8-like protein 3 [Sarcophilus harrisii]|uniref:epidermal growth factor receptor kinase substrate 8-like protein 3 n=1 Tax=Sarcophilus harrisii TaxID=9305 RepID=UPI001301AD65|nr:epidermal growth factor receptor kinase substrate 8-like protein 3 [Sarcophilus harrisii]
MARPSNKTIYQQRKEYSQAMASEPIILKQRVEHLLTCKLGSGTLREPKDVITKLQMMDAQGQVWGQDVVLQVKDHWLQILDIETREEMDCYPLENIQSLDAILNSCSYNSVLLIMLQELGQSLTNILLFQCWEAGVSSLSWGEGWKAEILRNNLQKAINELKERREPRYRFGSRQLKEHKLEADPQERYPRNSIEHRLPASYQSNTQKPQRFDQFSPQKTQDEIPLDLEEDMEELNNTLSKIEQFVEMTKVAPKNNTKKNILGKKKTQKGFLSELKYIECFQMIKHALNLVGKLERHIDQPSAPVFVHNLFKALTMVITNCPNPHWAASVDVPQLTPKAIALLESCLQPNEMDLWKSLGEFWTTSTVYGADQESTNPTHTPKFYRQTESSEYPMVNHQHNPAKDQERMSPRPSLSQKPLLMQVQYEFESRNSKELTVVAGEVLEVLDQSRQWWLVQNEAGRRGYIPNNILEPLPPGLQMNRVHSSSPTRGPILRPSSKPQEVMDWLQAQNFSPITVKSLGVLTGNQLLHMQPRELRLVCPEDAPQIQARLEEMKMLLGVRQI